VSEVAVIFGGPSPEHDVSVLTGLQVARELQRSGHTVIARYWSKAGDWYELDAGLEAQAFVDGVPRNARPLRLALGPEGGFVSEGGRFSRGRSRGDAEVPAVNCCHGGPGEDGTLQAALDLAGISYTGPTAAGAALGMDKLAFGGVIATAELPCLPRAALDSSTEALDFPGPYIVKPRFGGSSIGIEVVADLATARDLVGASVHLRAGAVIEPYRPDLHDLQVGVRSWPELQLSAIERPLKSGAAAGQSGILGYADKYVGGEGMASAPRELPATLDSALQQRLLEAARVVAQLSSVRGVARIDFLSDGTDFYVNEINTIPGSLARYLWIEPKLSFADLLGDLLDEARQRPTHHYSAVGADGTVLRGAGSIAGKLA
jgi:D-alanine-D-alanine ligase